MTNSQSHLILFIEAVLIRMHGMLAMVSSHVGVGITLLCGVRIWDVRDVRVACLGKILLAVLTPLKQNWMNILLKGGYR